MTSFRPKAMVSGRSETPNPSGPINLKLKRYKFKLPVSNSPYKINQPLIISWDDNKK